MKLGNAFELNKDTRHIGEINYARHSVDSERLLRIR